MPILRRRRLSDHQEVDTEGSWAISYGDMITLLLSFFILFFSTNPEKDRMQNMESSLMALLQKQSRTPAKEEKKTKNKRESAVDEKLAAQLNAQVHKVGNKLIIEFQGVSFFDLGNVKLTQKGQAELQRFVKLYLPYSGNYVLGIRAYTDNKKVRQRGVARYKDNLELSALRSIAAMRTMQRSGLPLNRMKLGGYGELNLTAEELGRALASNPDHGRKGLALARKIILVVEPDVKEFL